MSDITGYEADPADVAALLQSLCGDLLAEPDPLVRYTALCTEQVRYAALESAIKQERGKALIEMKEVGGLTWEQVAEAAQLGTYQRAQKVAAGVKAWTLSTGLSRDALQSVLTELGIGDLSIGAPAGLYSGRTVTMIGMSSHPPVELANLRQVLIERGDKASF
jgi:hypothetical protein